jgi:ADP-heptose:LPS heptosyltransferase
MKILIIKFGAAGDVIRVTTLLHLFPNASIDWVVSDNNSILLGGLPNINRVILLSKIYETQLNEYDLVINLEDNLEAGNIIRRIKYQDLFGSYIDNNEKLTYTENSRGWFDLSLISKYGLKEANKLKFQNQRSFQEIVFEGLGKKFNGEEYLLPESPYSKLYGDVAIAPKAGKVWPMKNWAYFDELAQYIRAKGFIVNFLPDRPTMLDHLADVKNHSVLISGDSLPMHFALGSKITTISLFICTSPAEIYDYYSMKKIISPDIEKYWYRRDFDENAITSISLEEVIDSFNLITKRQVANA